MNGNARWLLAALALTWLGCDDSGTEAVETNLSGGEAGEAGSESATEGGDESATEAGDESATEGGSESATEGGSESATEGGSESATEGGSESATEGGSESATEGGGGDINVDIRVDNNRNGTIDMDDETEDENEDIWSETNGAVFLANIDDDLEQCPDWGLDVNLPKCKDSADDVVNGELDLKDLARMQTAPISNLPEGAKGMISVGAPGYQNVRIFVRNGEEFEVFNFLDDKLTVDQLTNGVELAIEGLDVVRNEDVWDGYITLTFGIISSGGESLGLDKVQMRVSPMMLYHHLLDAEVAYVAQVSGTASADFRADFQAGIEAANGITEYFPMAVSDQWNQDYFETGYMSMPTPEGQHAIRVNFRSANVDNPNNPDNPLRPAGQVVFSYLRGIDSAPIQEYDINHSGQMDSLNSFGNTETIPPYSYDGVDYPLGRIFRGSTASFYPDPNFSKMLEDQKIQEPLYVDTSWLLVGHVDETTSFLPADNDYGWVLVVNDAQMAIDMFEDLSDQGHGSVTLFEGKEWDPGVSAEVTIDEVLDDDDVMAESLSSAAEVEAQVAIIKAATGITEAEIVRIPYLHWTTYGYSVAYQPGTVNGILIDSKNFMPPKPHGPNIGGVDVMEEQFEEAYGAYGVNVHWVEDWDLYHRLLGEVHCGSNATREIPDVKWWETGR